MIQFAQYTIFRNLNYWFEGILLPKGLLDVLRKLATPTFGTTERVYKLEVDGEEEGEQRN